MFDITITKNAAESTLITKEAWYRKEYKYEFGKDDAVVIANGRLGVSRKTFSGGEIYCSEESDGWEYLTLTGNMIFINGGKTWFWECIDEDGKQRISVLWGAYEVDKNHNRKVWDWELGKYIN